VPDEDDRAPDRGDRVREADAETGRRARDDHAPAVEAEGLSDLSAIAPL
jgi:hypothetical protein